MLANPRAADWTQASNPAWTRNESVCEMVCSAPPPPSLRTPRHRCSTCGAHGSLMGTPSLAGGSHSKSLSLLSDASKLCRGRRRVGPHLRSPASPASSLIFRAYSTWASARIKASQLPTLLRAGSMRPCAAPVCRRLRWNI